jgi:hypothetical protein
LLRNVFSAKVPGRMNDETNGGTYADTGGYTDKYGQWYPCLGCISRVCRYGCCAYVRVRVCVCVYTRDIERRARARAVAFEFGITLECVCYCTQSLRAM